MMTLKVDPSGNKIPFKHTNVILSVILYAYISVEEMIEVL